MQSNVPDNNKLVHELTQSHEWSSYCLIYHKWLMSWLEMVPKRKKNGTTVWKKSRDTIVDNVAPPWTSPNKQSLFGLLPRCGTELHCFPNIYIRSHAEDNWGECLCQKLNNGFWRSPWETRRAVPEQKDDTRIDISIVNTKTHTVTEAVISADIA